MTADIMCCVYAAGEQTVLQLKVVLICLDLATAVKMAVPVMHSTK